MTKPGTRAPALLILALSILGAVGMLVKMYSGRGDETAAGRPLPTPPPAEPTAVREPPSPPRGSEPLSSEALDSVQKATVFIESRYRPLGSDPATFDPRVCSGCEGSGFVVNAGGLIITNEHVVASFDHYEGEGATPGRRAANARTLVLDSVSVRLYSGTDETRVYPAEVLATRPFPDDLALIRIRPDAPLTPIGGLDPANRTSVNNMIGVTHRVWAVGFPLGTGMEDTLEQFEMTRNPHGPDVSVREGQITSVRKGENGRVKAVEHSCNIEHGNSGGPLVDSRGLLVGVISLGNGTSAWAIPLDSVLDRFFDTLACHGYGNMFELASTRTLTVDPSSKESDPPATAEGPRLTYASLTAALEAAKNGDEILLAAAEFPLIETLPIRTGVRVRGAGVGKTVIRARGAKGEGIEGYAVAMGGARFVEVSNLTIVNESGNGVWFDKDSGAEQYLHDVEIRAGAWGLGFGEGSRANVVRCSVQGDVWLGRKDAQPRLERVSLRAGSLPRFDPVAVEILGGASPQLIGCRISAPGIAVRVGGDSKVRMRGCEVAAGTSAGISISAGSAEIEACWICSGDGSGIHLEKGASAAVAATRIMTRYAPAVFVEGTSTHVTLSGAVLESLRVAVRVEAGAAASLTGNAVLHDARRVHLLPWTDGPTYVGRAYAGELAQPYRTPEEQARWEEIELRRRAPIPFGIVILGEGSTAEGGGNLFATNDDGTAVREEPGATWWNRGGNEAPGATHEFLRATDDR